METTCRRCARTIADALIWYHFLPLHSTHGMVWYQVFQSSGAERIGLEFDHLVARMRRPHECLATISRDLEAARQSMLRLVSSSVQCSIRGVLEEAYRGSLAYLRFRQGSLESADGELEVAIETVRDTIRSDATLFTFSLRIPELVAHRARVAIKQRDWAKTNRLLDDCRRIITGDAPLHSDRAKNVYLQDISSFYQSIEPGDALDAEALEILAKPGAIARDIQRTIDIVVNSLRVANDF